MISSLFSGISGLVSNTLSLDVIGNNIANVNTVGYKESRATFADFFYQSLNATSGTSQVGRGSTLGSIDTIFSQGSFETTSSPTDLAIGGNGFFIVKMPDSDVKYYTRAGQFNIDKDGALVNTNGYILQGKNSSGVDTDIKIQRQATEAKPTSTIGMYANLQSNAAWKGTVGSLGGTGSITSVTNSDSQYTREGDYSAAIALRTAAGTGSSAYSDVTGTLKINGVSVTETSAADIDTLITDINAASGMAVTASKDTDGTHLILTANNTGVDITVDDSGISSGSIGWTTADKANSGLYGASLSLTVNKRLHGTADGTDTYSDNISVSAGTLTNWKGSGLDITHDTVSSSNAGTQTFNLSGFDVAKPADTSDYSSSITAYDSLGNQHLVTVYFRKSYEDASGNSVWEWSADLAAKDSSSGVNTEAAWGELKFDSKGNLSYGGDAGTISFDFLGGLGQTIKLSFQNGPGNVTTTQLPMASTTTYQTQDGYPPGELTTVAVSTDGVLSASYSNGQKLDLYTITLAEFNNPTALEKEGYNLYSKTQESGDAFTNTPGVGGLGKISPNSLEESNVDIATEFVKMIVAQRGFQANSRVITTTDEVLQEIMNLKR